jgi:hypothetical protein
VRTLPKLLIGLGAIAVVVAVAAWLGRVGGKLPGPSPAPATEEENASVTGESNRPSFFSKVAPKPALTNGEAGEIMAATGTNAIADWEGKVDEILGSSGEAPEKAKRMLELFSRLPEAGQVEVVRHLSNLLPNEDYASMGQLLLEPQLPADVSEALIVDLLNRPNSLKMPLLLEVARNAQHSQATKARETLALLLENNYGEDWDRWQAAMEKWLKDNPD